MEEILKLKLNADWVVLSACILALRKAKARKQFPALANLLLRRNESPVSYHVASRDNLCPKTGNRNISKTAGG